MTVVFFHTDDSLYSGYADLLESSLKRLNIEYFRKVIPKESWHTIVNIKPSFLLECRAKIKGDILYIDADAFVHSDFRDKLSQIDCDIAFCRNRNYITGTLSDRTGTVLIKETQQALELLQLWKVKSDADNTRWDQATLSDALEELSTLKTHYLDHKYTYIFDDSSDALKCSSPVIEHLQASRLSDKKRKWHHLLFNRKSKRAKRTIARTKELRQMMNL